MWRVLDKSQTNPPNGVWPLPYYTVQARQHAITYCPAKVYCFGLNLRTIKPIVGWKLHRSAELAWLNKHRSTIATWLIISTGVWMKITLCSVYTSEHQSSFPVLAAYNSLAPYASHSSSFVKPFNQLKSFIRNTKLWTAFCNMVNNSLSELYLQLYRRALPHMGTL